MGRSTLRTWRTWVLAPVTGILLVAALLAPVPRIHGTAYGVQCLPGGSIDTVDQLDTFVSQVLDTPQWQGGDVGASVELLDGRHLFVFADTLRVTPLAGLLDPGAGRFPNGHLGLVRNSMLVLDHRCAQVVVPRDQGPVIPDRADGVGYWPMSAVRLGGIGYDLIGVSAQRVRSTDGPFGSIFSFEVLGPSAAVFLVPHGDSPRLLGRKDLGADDVDPARPAWGAATAVADGWVYLYGTARPSSGGSGFGLQVARTRPADYLDPDRWQYWDGSEWGTDPEAAAELIGDYGGVSQSLSVFTRDGRWYAISKRDEVLGTDLTIWTAPAPTGPFTADVVAAHMPSEASTGMLRYMPLAHPDLMPQRGSIVVSYSQNNVDARVILDDPRLYRPRFFRIPLPV